jgi:hypothetical protein
MKNIITTALMLTVGMSAMAQKNISQNIQEKDGKLKIHVESSQDGKKEVFERSYNVEGMSQDEKDKLVNRITDSLWTSSGDSDGTRKQIRIKVDRNGDNSRIETEENDMPFSFNSPKGKTKKRIEVYKDGKKIEKDIDGDGDNDITMFFKDFGNDMERKFKDFDHKEMFSSIEPMVKNFKFKLDGDMKDFDFMNESKTVKALKIYPNKPFDNKLNLKFYAPEKGDILVIVTDLNGKEVGSQKFKDFQGDFMGQVDLKKNIKGTLFVTVTQGQDGTAKRVVVE